MESIYSRSKANQWENKDEQYDHKGLLQMFLEMDRKRAYSLYLTKL